MKIGDLVKPKPAYLDDYTSQFYLPAGIIVEEEHCDGGGHLEPETVFTVEWTVDCSPDWNDYELELVSESR